LFFNFPKQLILKFNYSKYYFGASIVKFYLKDAGNGSFIKSFGISIINYYLIFFSEIGYLKFGIHDLSNVRFDFFINYIKF